MDHFSNMRALEQHGNCRQNDPAEPVTLCQSTYTLLYCWFDCSKAYEYFSTYLRCSHLLHLSVRCGRSAGGRTTSWTADAIHGL